jgi:hypothetical protein
VSKRFYDECGELYVPWRPSEGHLKMTSKSRVVAHSANAPTDKSGKVRP